MQKNKKVVLLGGGTGTSFVVKGLKYFPIDLTCVITVSDDGSSTGRLRKEFATPAVGDIRKVLSNLSTLPDEIRDVMEYRLKAHSDLNGHALGNLVLTSLIKETGSLQKSIKYLSKILDVKQTVLPLSEDYLTLMGETLDGEVIEGEEEITKAHRKYKEFFYKEEPHVLPEVFDAIKDADLIILSTGSLYTSVMPHIICKDVAKAIRESSAKVMYICNVMTQPGETDGFGVSDHVNALEHYLGKDEIDVVIASNTRISYEMLKKYETEEQKDQVMIDYDNIRKGKYEFIEDDLITTADGTIKHNSLKLSSVIFSYLMR
ncbi:MAG: YvcK family protein [Clostridia bacterium]|nr:YvcK family protein [Clostridia bacterium]